MSLFKTQEQEENFERIHAMCSEALEAKTAAMVNFSFRLDGAGVSVIMYEDHFYIENSIRCTLTSELNKKYPAYVTIEEAIKQLSVYVCAPETMAKEAA